jgi:hypothetical protein
MLRSLRFASPKSLFQGAYLAAQPLAFIAFVGVVVP